MRIDGTTRLAGVMGAPVAHSLSPVIQNAAFEAMGLPWVYLPLLVENAFDVPVVVSAIRALPFVGFNVTMPYKRMMVELCDEVSVVAQIAGAVNTVVVDGGRMIGYNTDGHGLLASLKEEAGVDPAGLHVAMVGSGGAAGAALASLVLAGARRVSIISRNERHSIDLVERMRPHARATELVAMGHGDAFEAAVGEAEVLVNATPVGMKEGDPLPVDPLWLHPGQVVCDMIYAPIHTKLLAAAEDAGATAISGLGMLVEQGAMSLELWAPGSTASVPKQVMRDAAEAVIAASASREAGVM